LVALRGVISTIWCLLWVNKNVKRYVWDDVSSNQFSELCKRAIQGSLLVFVQFSVAKYLSLVYIGLAQNIAPLVTIVMSYFMIGEKLKPIDIFLIIITCAGVTLITLGFGHTKAELNEVDDAQAPLLAKLGALTVPFLLSYGNILMSKLKGLNENTVSLYMNPATAVLMIMLTYAEGLDFAIFGEARFDRFAWAIMIGISVLSVVTQTLKFVALQNE